MPSSKCFKDIFEWKRVLGMDNTAIWEYQLCGGDKRLWRDHTWLRALGNGAAWPQRRTGLSSRSCPGPSPQGAQRQVCPETNPLKQRVSPTHSRQAQRSTASHLRAWAAGPGGQVSLRLLPSSIQGWTRKEEWGKRRSMWLGHVVATLRARVLGHAHATTKPGFVRFTASSIFLIQKAVWAIKYLEERKQKVQSWCRSSHVGTSKHNKLQTENTEAPLKRVSPFAFRNKEKYKDLNGRMKPKNFLR